MDELRNCVLIYQAADVRAGSSFELSLFNPAGSDSADQQVSFVNLDVELSGPVKVVRRMNKLKLKVLHETKTNPFITISLKISGTNEFVVHHRIPVVFDQEYRIYYGAKRGKNGKSGRFYWECNLMHDHEIMLHDSDYCHMDYRMDEKVHGRNGRDGMPLEVYVQMVPNGDNSKLLEVEVRDSTGKSDVRYLSPNGGKIWIESAGGFGGNGDRCEPAHYLKYDSTAVYEIPKENLRFGQAGNGGNGGRGGDISVYITKEAKMFYDQIYLDNPGAQGGWGYLDAYPGDNGLKGEMGKVEILDWNGKR